MGAGTEIDREEDGTPTAWQCAYWRLLKMEIRRPGRLAEDVRTSGQTGQPDLGKNSQLWWSADAHGRYDSDIFLGS
jgi:hypothetical protein